jgi:SnoaL-like protein
MALDPRFAQILERSISPEEYGEIRDQWLKHVTNEEKLFVPHTEAEGSEALETALTSFIDDCEMELVFAGERWTGKDGARKFYATFLAAFEGMEWVPQALVVGPQGVLDVVNMTATLRQPFAGFSDVGKSVRQEWVIFFPWVPDERRFAGEIVYTIRALGEHESVTIPDWRRLG